MLAFQFDHVRKTYDGFPFIDEASFSIVSGHVHAILGMNGSGKSTLVKLLSGSLTPDAGQVFFEENPVAWKRPTEARMNGIATVNICYELMNNLHICENIYAFGYPYKTRHLKHCSLRKMAALSQEIFDKLDFDINPYAYPNELTPQQTLMVQLAMVISQEPRVIILDNPFVLLERNEIQSFLPFFALQKSKGVTTIFTTGDIETAMMLSDEITIIKEHKTATYTTAEHNADFFANAMSDTATYKYPRIKTEREEEVLRLKGVSTQQNSIRDISFSMKRGEILGVAGLFGAGRSTLAKTIFGLEIPKKGKIYVNGEQVWFLNPHDAISYGIGYMRDSENEDNGIIENFSIMENITLASLSTFSNYGFLNQMKEKESALKFIKNYSIHPSDMHKELRNLTEGNKQKAIFCRWILKNSKILILDKITRGLDISSKVELYNYMNKFAMGGGSILYISDDYNELIGMCDRILLMAGGRIRGTLSGESVTMRKIVEGLSGTFAE